MLYDTTYTSVIPSSILPAGVGLRDYHIQIFNTWGTLIWESRLLENGKPKEGWSGMYEGELVQQDVFVWKVNATFMDGTIWAGKNYAGIYKRTGTATLIK